ncbi:hypothetical protein GIB67_008856 [Kingdonia uniflora]|uniref:Uncharacterized protein n=1 Tax=Kingdonia uniflora TaxID=39325 RepID=A0A7J7LVL1_9MAGN|nr:hypothetical protein GIB67_008856 [Kingdonia uniflora]
MQVLKSLVLLIKAFLLLLLAPFQRRTTNNNDEKHEHQRKVSPTVLRVPAVMVPRRSNNNVSSVSVVARVVDVATRRALAIKRVVQEDKMCVREVFMFGTTRGDTLFTQSWMPVDVKINSDVNWLFGRHIYELVMSNTRKLDFFEDSEKLDICICGD